MRAMNRIIFNSFLVSACLGLLLWGCKGCKDGKKGEGKEEVSVAKEDTQKITTKGQKVKIALPSPFEIAALIKKSGVNYNYKLLNPVDNASKYNTTYKKGLNLGVYGADLGYAAMYQQTQTSIEYLNTIKSLSDDLGIIGAFEKRMIKRVEDNLGNRDSLIHIVAKSFSKADVYLKEHQRGVTSAYVLAGGWVESLYLACKLAESSGNKRIIQRIGEQKISLDLLLSLLDQYEQKSDKIKELKKTLNKLQSAYKGVDITYKYKPTNIDTLGQQAIVNTTSTIEITPEDVKKISDTVYSIRKQITQ